MSGPLFDKKASKGEEPASGAEESSFDPSIRPMTVEQYVAALRSTPQESLISDLGVRDNYTIFVQMDFNSLLQMIEQIPGCHLEGENPDKRWFRSESPQLTFQVLPFVTAGFVDVTDFESDYSATIMVHPEPPIEGVPGAAQFIADLAERLMTAETPMCLFSAKGDSSDTSRCVLFSESE